MPAPIIVPMPMANLPERPMVRSSSAFSVTVTASVSTTVSDTGASPSMFRPDVPSIGRRAAATAINPPQRVTFRERPSRAGQEAAYRPVGWSR